MLVSDKLKELRNQMKQPQRKNVEGFMLSESQNIEYKESWDDIPVFGATIDDIDRNAVDYFLQCSIKAGRMDEEEANASTGNVLRNLGLLTTNGEVKNAAILLFGKHVRQFFPSAIFK